jgi:cell division protein FtsB
MLSGFKNALRSPKTRLNILVILGVFILIWILFFDSHSVRNRWYWESESKRMASENKQFSEEIEASKRRIKSADTTFVIEERAREDFMMRRGGETVYRVEKR